MSLPRKNITPALTAQAFSLQDVLFELDEGAIRAQEEFGGLNPRSIQNLNDKQKTTASTPWHSP
jgi:hypothetical protein